METENEEGGGKGMTGPPGKMPFPGPFGFPFGGGL
jgi:hypothetical protein